MSGDSMDVISVIKEIPNVRKYLRENGEYRKDNVLGFAEVYLNGYYKKLQKTNVSFGRALDVVKNGKGEYGMRLPQWQPDVIIKVQYPDENSKMTAPYLYVESRYGRVPWKETMIELFSDKWEIVELVSNERES